MSPLINTRRSSPAATDSHLVILRFAQPLPFCRLPGGGKSFREKRVLVARHLLRLEDPRFDRCRTDWQSVPRMSDADGTGWRVDFAVHRAVRAVDSSHVGRRGTGGDLCHVLPGRSDTVVSWLAGALCLYGVDCRKSCDNHGVRSGGRADARCLGSRCSRSFPSTAVWHQRPPKPATLCHFWAGICGQDTARQVTIGPPEVALVCDLLAISPPGFRHRFMKTSNSSLVIWLLTLAVGATLGPTPRPGNIATSTPGLRPFWLAGVSIVISERTRRGSSTFQSTPWQ